MTGHGPQWDASRPVLITGGAGFIGTNVANRLLEQGRRVLLLDSLCRAGVEQNVQWLQQRHGSRVAFERGNVAETGLLRRLVHEAGAVFHFAAQVAVTTSLLEPRPDFETNVVGTFNLLEALREEGRPIPLLYTSTNKVYGNLEDVPLQESHTRYEPQDAAVRAQGISEARALDFHTPYGCSKGAADQYVVDYARSYRLPLTVFRMSCIYGPHQHGTEDQGWVAHFLLRLLEGQPITVFGDGKQVRDILFVDDLVNAMLAAHAHIDRTAGQAFNMGGGPSCAVSLRELLALMRNVTRQQVNVQHEDWRPGDQRYYVSDTSRFSHITGWHVATGVQQGIEQLWQWLKAHHTAAEPMAVGGRSR